MPTHGFSTKPLKVKLLAGEQKATEFLLEHLVGDFGLGRFEAEGNQAFRWGVKEITGHFLRGNPKDGLLEKDAPFFCGRALFLLLAPCSFLVVPVHLSDVLHFLSQCVPVTAICLGFSSVPC